MPAPQIPAPTLVADLVILTTHRAIRSRTYWASDTAPADVPQLTALADAVKAAFSAAVVALLPENHFFQRVEARWYGSGSTFFFANSTSAAAPGDLQSYTQEEDSMNTSDNEDTMPDDTCLILQKKTGLRGRSKQGRIFFGGISEKVQNAGEVITSATTKVKALAAKLNTDINVSASGYTTVLHGRHWDRKNNLMLPITQVYAVKAIGSRMDRRPKVLMERL